MYTEANRPRGRGGRGGSTRNGGADKSRNDDTEIVLTVVPELLEAGGSQGGVGNRQANVETKC